MQKKALSHEKSDTNQSTKKCFDNSLCGKKMTRPCLKHSKEQRHRNIKKERTPLQQRKMLISMHAQNKQ
jgi:hypothetical protein